MTNILYPYKQVVYIDSNFRSSGTSDNFTIDLSKQILNSNNYDRIVLTSASIPKSYYNIDDSNESFILTELGVDTLITLIHGNYSYSTLATALALALTNASPNTWTYTCTTSQLTGRYTFGVSGNGGVQPSFGFVNKFISLIIGFDSAVYPFVANALESPNVVNLQLASAIQVNSDIVAGSSSVLSSITPDNPAYAIINYNEQNPAYVSVPTNGASSKSVRFWITDTRGRLIDLNGLDWSCVLTIYKLDDSNNKKIQEMRDRIIKDNLDRLMQ